MAEAIPPCKPMTRRSFMQKTALVAAGAAVPALGACAGPGGHASRQAAPLEAFQAWPRSHRPIALEIGDPGNGRLLLRDGLVVDGTGKPAFYGDVLLRDDRIEVVTAGRIRFPGPALDCAGKVVAPGFIDAHSHMDWVMPMTTARPELCLPFTEQGVTTFVAGNCGFGIAGFRPGSPHEALFTARTNGIYRVDWTEMGAYFDHLDRIGIHQNLVNLSGHGTTRASIKGFDAAPMDPGEMREMLGLLEETMDQGAWGVSLGLQYEPGVFATMDELKRIAALVRKKDRILTVHMKAYSSLSGTYPLKLFGRPHNLLAIEDMIGLARQTGVRLQLSHLIFVGSRTWDTCGEALDLIDGAIGDGLDLQFDSYAYHCGTSVINVFMPEWFLAKIPEAFNQGTSLMRLRMEIGLIESLLGFGYDDIQITDAGHPDLDRYNGLFIQDIARQRGMSPFENFIDIARKSEGRARVLNHRYSNMDNLALMMQHPAVLFMTDATPALKGVQNPGTYGNFPRYLQYARDLRLLSLEACVHKMTGASAERFGIRDRGTLRPGQAADITVFDWEKVRDCNTRQETDRRPEGIAAVFINGVQVLKEGRADGRLRPGRVLRCAA